MKKILSLGLLLTVMIVSLISVGSFADSVEEGNIEMKAVGDNIFKGYFLLNLNPGDEKIVTINLKNSSKQYSATGTLFAADAVTAQGGGIGIISPEMATRSDMGSWFDLVEEDITLMPGESRDVKIKINVPEDARAGDNIGAIVFSKFIAAEDNGDGKSKVLINKAFNQTIAAVVKLPGEAEHKLTAETIEATRNGSVFYTNIEIFNDGNVFEPVTGTLQIKKLGFVVHEEEFKMGSIYPKTSGKLAISLPVEAAKPGSYKANITLNYADVVEEQSLDYKIKSKEVKQAKLSALTAEKNGIVASDLIVFTPMTLIMMGLGLIVVIGLAVFGILKFKKVI